MEWSVVVQWHFTLAPLLRGESPSLPVPPAPARAEAGGGRDGGRRRRQPPNMGKGAMLLVLVVAAAVVPLLLAALQPLRQQ